MKERPTICRKSGGYCLAELLLVISLICISFGIGYATLPSSLHRQEARALSQTTQAALAWAQVGVLWHAGAGCVRYDGSGLEVVGLVSSTEWGGDLGGLVSAADVTANVSRWNTTEGFALRFLDPFAAPDGGGSLYFKSGGGAYKVTVRPESGLSTRKWIPE